MDDALAAVQLLGAAAIAVWLWVAAHRDGRARSAGPRGATPSAPRYRLVLCEGDHCVLAPDLGGGCPAVGDAEGVIECRAAQYRAAGAVGRLVLVEAKSGTTVASRRVWP